MGTLVWFLIIMVFIISFIRNRTAGKSKKGSAGAKQTGAADSSAARPDEPSLYKKQAKPNRPKPGTKTAKPNRPKSGTKTAKPNKPKPKTAQAKPNVPTGETGRERYDSYKKARQSGRSASSAVHQMHVDDILESARENNQAVEIDNDMDTIEIGDLMARVQDNIVRGPADTLSFQRDFVAEGMDLLNRYLTIPGTEEGI